jgi:hypothetical protein
MQNIYPDSLGKPPENLPVIATADHAEAPVPKIRANAGLDVSGQREELGAVVSGLFDDLCGSFTNAMKDYGIDIGLVRIPWRPITDDQDAIKRLSRVTEIWAAVKVKGQPMGW